MAQLHRKKKFQSTNFYIPQTNILDLRSFQKKEIPKRKIDKKQYFETNYQNRITGHWWKEIMYGYSRFRNERKERKLALKLADMSRCTLDSYSQELLSAAQNDRLKFLNHQDTKSLREAEQKYQIIQTHLKQTEKQKPISEKKKTKTFFAKKEKIIAYQPVFDHIPRQPISSEPKTSFQVGIIHNPIKSAVIFAGICVFFIFPLVFVGWIYPYVRSTQGRVLGVSNEAIEDLTQASKALIGLQFDTADQRFDWAFQKFSQAKTELDKYGMLFPLIPVKGAEGTVATRIISALQETSEAGKSITKAVSILSSIRSGSFDDMGLTPSLLLASTNLAPAAEHLEKASAEINKISIQSVPTEYRDAIGIIKKNFPILLSYFKDTINFSDVLLTILGHDSPRRYLVIFQNNEELRPTGGFIGALAYITLDRGMVKDIEIPEGGIYDISGQMTEKVISPEPLHLVNPHWNIQDANWFPDFPTSAQKIMSFYTASGRPSIDGILAVTPEVAKNLLHFTGPVYLEKYGYIVDESNFIDLINQEKEKNKDTKAPKAIIADLTPVLLQKVLTFQGEDLGPIMNSLDELLARRDILFYFRDEKLENLIRQYGWAGEIKTTDRDFLLVNHANIAGGKTDQYIDERIEHEAEILPNGKIIDTVRITRTHQGSENIPEDSIKNISYTRFYVPKGSRLLETRGFSEIDPKLFLSPESDHEIDSTLRSVQGDIYIDEYSHTRINQEFGHTVFGNWITTDAGKSSQAMIKYELPFRINVNTILQTPDHYSLYIQKQPGLRQPLFSSIVQYPENWGVWWYGPQKNVEFRAHSFRYSLVLEKDCQYGIVFGMGK